MNIFATREREWMRRFQQVKDRALAPLLDRLIRIGVTANGVSVSSAVVAVAGLMGSFVTGEPFWFLVGIWGHILLDGIDGSLARASENETGLTADLGADSVGIACLGLYLLLFEIVAVPLAIAFIMLYLAINVISFTLALRDAAYYIVLRPRLIVISTITLDQLVASSVSPVAVLFSDIAMAVFVVLGMRTLAKTR